MKHNKQQRGFTILEVLIALAILGVVFLLVSSGIIGALRVQRVQEDATSSQAKLRRTLEVVTQELRGAVLGGLTDSPVLSGATGISFALLSGGGGLLVVDRDSTGKPTFGTTQTTSLFAADKQAISVLKGQSALVINSSGDAVIIPEITGVRPDDGFVTHKDCRVQLSFTPNTQLFGMHVLGLDYEKSSGTLFRVSGDGQRMPLAFDLTDFSIGYQYESGSKVLTRAEPARDGGGLPLNRYSADGATYELMRLQVTIGTEAVSGGGKREYVGFVEMTGLANDRWIDALKVCDGKGLPPAVPGDGEDGGDGDEGSGDGGGGDEDDGGGSSGGDGGGEGGGGDRDDKDPPCTLKRPGLCR